MSVTIPTSLKTSATPEQFMHSNRYLITAYNVGRIYRMTSYMKWHCRTTTGLLRLKITIRITQAQVGWFQLNVTFVKIDVEGEELAVLEGMRETLLKYKPEMLVELHPPVTIQRVMEVLPVDYTFENLQGIQEEDIDSKTVCNYFLKPRQ